MAHRVALVPSPVDGPSAVDRPVPPKLPSRPNSGLPRFIFRLIMNITARILRYGERRVLPATTLQLMAEEDQEGTACSLEVTYSSATAPPIVHPRTCGYPVALIPKKDL
ncbi:hypothetical protein M407DRAFT_27246 [Tulasnella calospora MUT 4182]|uniref:Uncharacterized protein n=1 Tax=Tulasnella calospora MUT 4182 TaxID=1051891 RepID=A0A0C3QE70_9AGAM|nr:hypothetical protein M407DRAFT_27246 [Tulasnella calospora MUT 4182]